MCSDLSGGLVELLISIALKRSAIMRFSSSGLERKTRPCLSYIVAGTSGAPVDKANPCPPLASRQSR